MPVGTEGYIALYLRISKNKTGELEKIDRQERWGRAYAKRMIEAGLWPPLPVRVFADDDLSAFDDTRRPSYEELRKAIRGGEIAFLWCVEQTRLEANRKRWVDLAIEMDEAGLSEIHTDRDGIVRLDEVADIKATLAWHERKRLRKRTTDTLADLADEGRPAGGTAFGYRHVVKNGQKALEVIPEQAEAAQWAAQAVLSGWSLAAVARELTERRVPTARGGKWRTQTIRQMLTSPTIAGHRVYRGQLHRRGNWEPILDETTWHQVCAVLAGKREITRTDGTKRFVSGKLRPRRRYLLTGGIAVCGRCDAPLIAVQRRDSKSGLVRPDYLCHESSGGCNGLGIRAEPLEEHVRGELISYLLAKRNFGAALAEDEHEERRHELSNALAEVARRKVRLSTRWARGDLDEDEWDAARADLDDQRTELQAQLAAVPAPAAADVDPESLRDDWEEMTLDERRMVIATHVGRVTICPATRRGGGFDKGRVKILFVGEA